MVHPELDTGYGAVMADPQDPQNASDIKIVKVTAPQANNAPAYDVILHLDPAPPPGWREAFLTAWNGGGMPVPLPTVDFGPSSISVKNMTLSYVKGHKIAESVKLAIERAGPIYEEQLRAKAEEEQRRAQQAQEQQAETDRLLADISQQIAD